MISEFIYRIRASIGVCRRRYLWDAKTYYPELVGRPAWKNLMSQICQVLKWGNANEYYFMYGLDVKTKEECKQYVNYNEFYRRRDELNLSNRGHNSTCLLRNKLYFDIFAKSIGINTPHIVAYYSNNNLYLVDERFRQISFLEFSKLGDMSLFCKEVGGECGAGIFRLVIESGLFYINGEQISVDNLEDKIKNTDYIFQNIVQQHEKMSELYSGSVNTMRLVTVRSLKDGSLHIMPSILRIGANGSMVDNTSQGGIAVGFNLQTGQLNQYGFHKPEFGLRTEYHPNSNIRLCDFHIPFIKEAEEQALFFHSMLKDIHSVGWDIAIGPDGPVFIEGNDNWEINGPQVGNHGLMKEYLDYFFY